MPGFNPFSYSFEDNELYFLSFCVPAKPGIAKDLIEANGIGRKDVADFIDSLLAKKSVFHDPIKCYKLVKFFKLVEIVQFTKRKQPNESLTFLLT